MSRIDENAAYFGNGVKRAMIEENGASNNDRPYRSCRKLSATVEKFLLNLNADQISPEKIRSLQENILRKQELEQELRSLEWKINSACDNLLQVF